MNQVHRLASQGISPLAGLSLLINKSAEENDKTEQPLPGKRHEGWSLYSRASKEQKLRSSGLSEDCFGTVMLGTGFRPKYPGRVSQSQHTPL